MNATLPAPLRELHPSARTVVVESPRRFRALRGGRTIVDCARPRLLFGVAPYPVYYFPVEDCRLDLLLVEDERDGLVRPRFRDGDDFYEEDERLFTPIPKSPFHRVDALASSRTVEVRYAERVVARSTRPVVVYETGLPPRYYLPLLDVAEGIALSATSRTWRCPYKGVATYWSLGLGSVQLDNVAWTYEHPIPESQRIAGLVCFDGTRVTIEVDGARAPEDDAVSLALWEIRRGPAPTSHDAWAADALPR